MKNASLYLLPTPLKPGNIKELSEYIKNKFLEVDIFIVERRSSALRLLNKLLPRDKEVIVQEFNAKQKRRTNYEIQEEIIHFFIEEKKVAFLSEAGLPNVADPGREIIMLAHKLRVPVKIFGSGSSVCMAVAASGLQGNSFAFNGYLPIPQGALRNKIKQLENIALKKKQVQIFMEAPHRNQKILEMLVKTLKPTTALSVVAGINYEEGFVKTFSVAEWQRHYKNRFPEKLPALFLIGKETFVKVLEKK